jgi:hypothetical protein
VIQIKNFARAGLCPARTINETVPRVYAAKIFQKSNITVCNKKVNIFCARFRRLIRFGFYPEIMSGLNPEDNTARHSPAQPGASAVSSQHILPNYF